MTVTATAGTVLEVSNLTVDFATENGTLRAVDGVSFSLAAGGTLALVGESGCGKTVTGLALLGLIPSPPGRVAAGQVRLGGTDLLQLDESAMRGIRGARISMIFQEPMTALNPVYRVGSQMTDVLRRHQGLTRRQARAAAIEMLGKTGIPSPEQRIDEYPHQLSGGMRQRVMIAMALSCEPDVLVADEPTTALDVTTQAQVLEQIVKLQREFGMAMILVTHDLGVVAETCDEALVMYAGRIVEQAPVIELFERPRHPYTAGLLASIPRIREQRLERLPVIEGMVPDLLHLPEGCRFADRCPKVKDYCRLAMPELRTLGRADSRVAAGRAEPGRSAVRVACYVPN